MIEKKLTVARKHYYAVLQEAQATERVLSSYTSSFENPYAETAMETRSSVERAITNFGPLLKEAILAGHHGRWIQNRLPAGFKLCLYRHHYAIVLTEPIGVCIDVTVADSHLSQFDLYVKWSDREVV